MTRMEHLTRKITYHHYYRTLWWILAMVLAFFLGPIKCQAVTLTINSTNGSVTATPAKVDYNIGEIVELMPNPNTGYSFAGWAGDAHGKSLVLNLTMDSDKVITANFGTWQPPIGVLAPQFGIFETYRMYDNPANRNSTLTYTQNFEGGYYTHYIDNTHPSATDTNNPYGTESTPRKTVPWNLPAGSVVEIHGGPYTHGVQPYANYWTWFSGIGTAAQPIFIRGADQNLKPVHRDMSLRIGGEYLIIENLDLDAVLYGGFDFNAAYTQGVWNFIVIRNIEIHDNTSDRGSLISIKGTAPGTCDNIVIYNNHIHHNGVVPINQDTDVMGLWVGDYAKNVWVVDNHMHHHDGDSIQLNANGGREASAGQWPEYVYIGRNVFHYDRENAIDLKDCGHVIISQNNIYGYFLGNYGGGYDEEIAICGANENNHDTWIMFNEVYDSGLGIFVDDIYAIADTKPNIRIIGNTFYNLSKGVIWSARALTIWIVNNTTYNVNDYGFWADNWPSPSQYAKFYFANNIWSNITGLGFHISVEYANAANQSTISNELFYQNGGSMKINWGGTTYTDLNVFQSNSGKGAGSIEADPLFVNALVDDYHLQSTSPAIDLGTSSGVVQQVFDTFQTLYGIDIRKDIGERARPQGSEWDIGTYEYTLSDIDDLAVSDASRNSVTVIWTLPGDVEQDLPARYDMRYSTNSLSEATWDTATQVQGEPIPGNYGAQQSFTITGLNSGTTYYIGIKTSNDTGSTTSSLSNVVSGSTATSGNYAPVLQLIGDKSVAENDILTFVVTATDADPGDTLVYSATDMPSGASFDPATQTFIWTPSSSQGGTYHVTFHVSDGLVTISETITITVTGVQSTLTISSTSGGSVTSPGEGNFSYNDGTSVFVQATAITNYHFVDWTGTAVNAGKVANTNAASTTVNVDADYTLQANFAIDQRTLTFSSTAGGSVTVPGEGAYSYDHGTFVAIQATPVSNYSFVNWTGTAVNAGKVVNPNSVSSTVTADADYTIQANFAMQDGSAPTVTNLSPSADDIQVPLNSLIILHVMDAGIGVDASSVSIALDDSTIYTGDTASYNSSTGYCCRTGTPADFTYVYQPSQNFDFDQILTVTVNASDLGGIVMTQQSYSFTTEMRSFSQNIQVDSTVEGLDEARSSVARDSGGNIWAVWHTGPVGDRDIYISKLDAGDGAFVASLPLISHGADQSNPAIAIGTDDRLYVVWQDNRQAGNNLQGEWDIYISTSLDGMTWSLETRVNDPNEDNQVNPAIVVDSQSLNYAYVVWQDDRAGNQDIFIASSNDGFATKTVSQITSDSLNQTEPAIAVDSSNTVCVLWTDDRNPTNGLDIYGAASNAGPWTNVPVVSNGADQLSPVIAVESTGTMIHMLWTDQTSGDSGIYYVSSDGLPGSALTGSNLIDDYAKGNGQFSPAISVTGSTGNDLKVFACWHDERDISGGTGDTDIWFAQANSSSGTNVFVGDGGTNSNQTEPAISVDQNGYPYVFWTDDRGANTEIYFAASTYLQPTVLAVGHVTPTSLDVTIGTDPEAITDVNDFSIQLLAGTCPYDVNITISEIENPPENTLQYFLNGCDFGPSGINFDVPVTITIPYAVTSTSGTPTAYWYNSHTGTLSQEGITNIEIIELTSSLHALRFNTTHLTPFFAMQGGAISGGGGGGGGGCSLSHSQEGNVVEYFLPYGLLVLLMIVLKWRDRKYRTFAKTPPK